METTPEIQSSVNTTDKQPQALLKFPQQFGERSEQVSSKDNSSKSSTLIRLQYDDPKITEVSKPAENISDTSNKVILANYLSKNVLYKINMPVASGCRSKS